MWKLDPFYSAVAFLPPVSAALTLIFASWRSKQSFTRGQNVMQDNGQIFDHAKLPSDINKNPVRFKAGDTNTKYVFPVCKTKKKKMMTPTLQRMVSWEWQNL